MNVTIDTIRDAARVLEGQLVRPPAMAARHLSRLSGADVFVKLENLQITGSFKVRGAARFSMNAPRCVFV